MTFRVGQKVVCVNVEPLVPNTLGLEPFLTKNAIYRIRWIGEHPYAPWRKYGLGVRVEGIIANDGSWIDLPFAASRFRPLTERSTDTGFAILKKLLTPTKVKAPL